MDIGDSDYAAKYEFLTISSQSDDETNDQKLERIIKTDSKTGQNDELGNFKQQMSSISHNKQIFGNRVTPLRLNDI